MSDDITFCSSETCKNKDCFRHRSNIKEPRIPHSFLMFEGTEYCEYYTESTCDGCKYKYENDTFGFAEYICVNANSEHLGEHIYSDSRRCNEFLYGKGGAENEKEC